MRTQHHHTTIGKFAHSKMENTLPLRPNRHFRQNRPTCPTREIALKVGRVGSVGTVGSLESTEPFAKSRFVVYFNTVPPSADVSIRFIA